MTEQFGVPAEGRVPMGGSEDLAPLLHTAGYERHHWLGLCTTKNAHIAVCCSSSGRTSKSPVCSCHTKYCLGHSMSCQCSWLMQRLCQDLACHATQVTGVMQCCSHRHRQATVCTAALAAPDHVCFCALRQNRSTQLVCTNAAICKYSQRHMA